MYIARDETAAEQMRSLINQTMMARYSWWSDRSRLSWTAAWPGVTCPC
jgi:hypothetical protein